MKKSKKKIASVGRPKVGDVKKAISICLDAETISLLEKGANKSELSKSAFIAMLIENWK